MTEEFFETEFLNNCFLTMERSIVDERGIVLILNF